MPVYLDLSDDEFPDLRTILLPRSKQAHAETKPLRRSPRKLTATTTGEQDRQQHVVTQTVLSATSSQRQLSPTKGLPSKRSPLKAPQQTGVLGSLLEDAPVLPRKDSRSNTNASAGNKRLAHGAKQPVKDDQDDLLLESFSRLVLQNDEPKGTILGQSRRSKRGVEPVISTTSAAIRDRKHKAPMFGRPKETQRASRFVLDEARCEEDLNDSDAQDEGEDEDTDLSGFIVDDDAEITYHESSEAVDSEEERRSRRKVQKEKPRRRLQRGRRRTSDSEDNGDDGDKLTEALSNMQLHKVDGEHLEQQSIEVVDLVSPEQKHPEAKADHDPCSSGLNLFDKFKALRLSPPKSSEMFDIPSKMQNQADLLRSDFVPEKKTQQQDRFTTPPATPPRSPSKLKSPSKLLSPSKRGDDAPRSPHRQSMDAFWDLNEVNEWNDQFSPKKAPLTSPRKNRTAASNLWSDAEEDSFDAIDESSDSLPSPCESPSKPRSRSVSPVKAEKQRFIVEKKARQAERQLFEELKDKMATDLLHALDKHVTGSKISKLSASTGGVQIIWSKTLRSTAGRANWRRTVTKSTGSPVKGKAEETAPGSVVQHFANIELATKIIDRQDRLISTLAHEFCHLANFMVSGIRDQPHGASFQSWGKKVTAWMESQNDVPEWKSVQVTTKHGYVIEWKYLWVCIGRDQNRAMEVLNINDEDGCGAEYGRHSKSIDTDKHRCGRCKGRLGQVRPRPRASPVKKTERKMPSRTKPTTKGVGFTEKLVEIIELSD